MSAALTPSQRLGRLEEILAGSQSRRAASVAEARGAVGHLESVPLERIRQLTELLETSNGLGDEVDGITMRLLLDHYVMAVAHLRAVSRDAGECLDTAAGPVNDVRRFLWREEKLQATLLSQSDGSSTDSDPAA